MTVFIQSIYLQNDDQVWFYIWQKNKEGNMGSNERFMYVNPTIRSDTDVAFF